MFVKLSALALCVSAISALQMMVVDDIEVDAAFLVALTADAGDPSYVDLIVDRKMLAPDVQLGAVGQVVYADITIDQAGESLLQAVNPADHSHVYAELEVNVKD